jgi:hypothetical protein
MPIDLSDFPRCEAKTSSTTIVLAEKGKKAVLNNPRKLPVRKFQIDGCVITQGRRCDYLVICTKPNRDIYVELKGQEILYAVEQLEATMHQVSSQRPDAQRLCLIVSSRFPKIGTDVQRWKVRFKDQYNATLTVKNKVLEVEI